MKLGKPVIIVLAALVLLWWAKDAAFGWALSAAVSAATGVPVSISSTQLDPMSGRVAIRGLRVKNPAGYKDSTMLDAPLLSIDCEPATLFSGKPHFEEVRVDLKELIVVRNKNGQLNVNAVKPKSQGSGQKPAASPSDKPAPQMRIDRLYLSIGKVVFKDYSSGDKPAVQTFDIGIKDREFRNIDSPSAVVSLLMVEALTRTTLNRIADLDIQELKGVAQDALKQGIGLAGDGADQVEGAAKGLLKMFQ
ncbi:MAG: hypothetical protein MOGMAGMI_00564 [Candidatus Omnitrophica bacterium]|nr:hypothetical protein [Candidatus Omnitrophota bacterium]